MKRCSVVVIALCFFGCTEEVSPPPIDNTVHLAGFLASSPGDGDNIAAYWRNGELTELRNGDIRSRATSLYVDGSSVFIGGWKRDVDGPLESVIWKDGVETIVEEAFAGVMIASRNNNLFGVWLEPDGWKFHKDGASQPIVDTAYTYAPTAMALVGDDIHISGASSSRALPPTFSPPQHAQYWKNGQLIFRESETSSAMSIFVHENNVYLAGYVASTVEGNNIACYWKNGQRVDLTDGGETAIAKSVFVTDSHVYVAGMVGDQAAYWMDGEVSILTSGGSSMANSIVVHGTDVHVGGYETWQPAYWRNNTKEEIADHEKLGQVLFIVVGSN